MPTPSPIMIPSTVASLGMVKTLLRSRVVPMPAPTPPSATAIGRPMASTDPNAMISTNMAKARPISSVCGGSTTARYWPPGSTSRPSIAGACSLIALPSSPDSVSSTSADKFTWA